MNISNKFLLPLVVLFTNSLFAEDPSQEMQRLNQRISLLESALAPTTPQSLVKTFAEAVKRRNGAVQYMLFCPDLQKQNLKKYEELNWVSGTSSPSYSSYKLSKGLNNQFTIIFALSLQGKNAGTTLDKLTIVPTDPASGSYQHFCISTYTRSTHITRSLGG